MMKMFDRDNTYSGSVCTDCVQLIANAEVPCDWSEEEVAKWLADIEKQNEGVEDVTLGHFHDSDRCFHNGSDCDADDGCNCCHTEFSRSSCDNCGSPLDGTREDAVFWLKSKVGV